jgi:hypothetical protein
MRLNGQVTKHSNVHFVMCKNLHKSQRRIYQSLTKLELQERSELTNKKI